MRISKLSRAMIDFAIHCVVGAGLFLLISGLAAGLHLLTKFFYVNDFAPSLVVQGMQAIELLLWIIDVALLIVFVLAESIKLIRKAISSLKDKDDEG